MVKATNFTSNLGVPLLGLNPANKALLMAMSAEAYVSVMLGPEEYAIDLKGFAQTRYRALQAMLGGLDFLPEDISLGELAGLAWLVELLKLKAIADAYPARTMFLDFDKFLADPEKELGNLTGFFGLAGDGTTLDRLLKSPVLNQYSKAPEYPFDAAARRARIEEVRGKEGAEIAKGLAFTRRLAKSHPRLGEAIGDFGYGVE